MEEEHVGGRSKDDCQVSVRVRNTSGRGRDFGRGACSALDGEGAADMRRRGRQAG